MKSWTRREVASTKHYACDRHFGAPRVGTCTRCGNNICETCRIPAAGKTFCAPCAMRAAGVTYRTR
jgi:hypothetical protein